MINLVKLESCDGCCTCVYNCPVEILEVINQKIKILDTEMCTNCGICVEVCPNGVLEAIPE